MKKGVAVRFVVALALFLGWIGYLVFLVFTSRHPVILSRPQLLVSKIDIIGRIDDVKTGEVTVEEVNWVDPKLQVRPQKGARIRVLNLEDCRPILFEEGKQKPGPIDWTGPGVYILPLIVHVDEYEVATIPPSPGALLLRGRDHGPPRIYPFTSETRAQLDAIAKPSQ
jgi:hypothetical protein